MLSVCANPVECFWKKLGQVLDLPTSSPASETYGVSSTTFIHFLNTVFRQNNVLKPQPYSFYNSLCAGFYTVCTAPINTNKLNKGYIL
jgi:hypothetical protein